MRRAAPWAADILLGAACPLLALPACGGDPRAGATRIEYGPSPAQTIQLYRPALPAGEAEPAPLLVFFPGGGFGPSGTSGAPETGAASDDESADPALEADAPEFGSEMPQALLEAALERGFAVACVDYRQHPEALYPEPQHDAARAVQTLRARAEELGVDPTRVAAVGQSAGACLAGWIALMPDSSDPGSDDPIARASSRPQCWGNLSGPVDFEVVAPKMRVPLFGNLRVEDVPEALRREASPAWLARGWTSPPPPCWSSYLTDVHPARTRVRHNGEHGVRLMDALLASGDTRSVLVVPDVRDSAARFADLLDWIEAQLDAAGG